MLAVRGGQCPRAQMADDSILLLQSASLGSLGRRLCAGGCVRGLARCNQGRGAAAMVASPVM